MNKNKLKKRFLILEKRIYRLIETKWVDAMDGDVGMSHPGLHQATDSFHLARQQNLLLDESPAQSPSLAPKYT